METNLSANKKTERSINHAFASHFAKSMFLTVLGIVVLAFIGTRMFTHVDLNLYGYMVGTIVFIGGFFYRFIAWGERPPTKIFIKKGLKFLFRKSTPKTAVEHLAIYRFHLEPWIVPLDAAYFNRLGLRSRLFGYFPTRVWLDVLHNG